MDQITASWLGRIGYENAFALQRSLAARRADDAIGDVVLLLEHDSVYTLGRRGSEVEILFDTAALRARGIQVVRSDRGGLVTYHGPGQLVGYPIIDLGSGPDVPGYVHALERALISTLADFSVTSTTVDGAPGVWVGDAKVAAIGVHVSRGVTTHGFALNVSTDLQAFDGIIACGMPDKTTASIQALTGSSPSVETVAQRAAHHLAHALGRALSWLDAGAFREAAHA